MNLTNKICIKRKKIQFLESFQPFYSPETPSSNAYSIS